MAQRLGKVIIPLAVFLVGDVARIIPVIEILGRIS